MLNQHDTIMVNVVGTEGQSRSTKRVSGRFNAQGVAVNEQGNATGEPGLDVRGLTEGAGAAVAIPEYPSAEHRRLQLAGDVRGIQQLGLDYQRQITALGDQGQGVGQAGFYGALAKAVLSWLTTYHGFSDRDQGRNTFVLKAENLEISPIKVNGATVYVVAGTAVFGK